MPNLNDPIDIDKDPKEVIMDQINVLNNTELDFNDFLFSLPESFNIPNTEINTKIVLTPKITSGYYLPRDYYYKRIDLSDIFNNRSVEILVDDEENISDLVDQINEKFGINLTDDDYVDVAIPEPDINIVNPSVMVQAKSESYFYVGTGQLVLGPKQNAVDDSNYIRNILVVTDSDEPSIYENTAVMLNTSFEVAGYFKLFRNTTNISSVRIDKILSLPNRNFYLGGNFEFEASLDGGPIVSYTCSGVIIDSYGMILTTSSTPLFGGGLNNHYGNNKNINSIYLADTESLVTPSNAQKLYKYNLDGSLDNTFNPVGISYQPVMVRVADDGKLYTVSPQFTAPVVTEPSLTAKQIRIDRLNSDGSNDNTFSTIYIRSTGIVDVTPVVDILPLTGGGGFVYLKPIHGLLTSGDFPIVNDVPFVDGSDPLDCAFNPIFRFNQGGSLVNSFAKVLINNSPESVMIDTVDISEDKRSMSYNQDKLIVLSNRKHPLSGFVNRLPVVYNTSGNIINMAPDKIAGDIRWESVVSFNKFDNGRFIISGNGKKKLITGGWGNPEYLIGLYNQSGQLISIAYKPVVVGVPIPEIYSVAVTEVLDS